MAASLFEENPAIFSKYLNSHDSQDILSKVLEIPKYNPLKRQSTIELSLKLGTSIHFREMLQLVENMKGVEIFMQKLTLLVRFAKQQWRRRGLGHCDVEFVSGGPWNENFVLQRRQARILGAFGRKFRSATC